MLVRALFRRQAQRLLQTFPTDLPDGAVDDVMMKVNRLVDYHNRQSRAGVVSQENGNEPVDYRRNGKATDGVKEDFVRLGNLGQDRMAGLLAVFETPVVVHPYNHDVLCVVPDIHDQPAMVDVAD